MISIGFIGVGNMGGALAAAATKNSAAKILLYDVIEEKASAVANELGAELSDFETICKNCDYIFVGVKPQVIGNVLADMAEYLKSRTDRYVIISMAAGVSTEKICQMLGISAPIIRIMPNLPVAVGEGMVLYSNNPLVKDSESEKLVSLMKFSGIWDKIEEDFIDAASALSGCGPAFVFMFINSLSVGGEKCGLKREQALKFAVQTVIGAGKMLNNSSADPLALQNAVCSPGGSTIEGVKSLQNDNFENMIVNAVEASFKRTKELGK